MGLFVPAEAQSVAQLMQNYKWVTKRKVINADASINT